MGSITRVIKMRRPSSIDAEGILHPYKVTRFEYDADNYDPAAGANPLPNMSKANDPEHLRIIQVEHHQERREVDDGHAQRNA